MNDRSGSETADMGERLRNALQSPQLRSVAELAELLQLSTRQVERLCRCHLGRSPKRLLSEQRLRRSIIAASQARPMQRAIDDTYADYAHFSRECRAILGAPPREIVSSGSRLSAVLDRLALPASG